MKGQPDRSVVLRSSLLFVLLLLLTTARTLRAENAVQADIVIRGATVYDGTGQPGKIGDVAICQDRIVAVGDFKVAGNPKILDATGLILAPGFIDLHTHSDRALTVEPTNQNLNYLRQGVTTVVTGNCGFGPANVADFYKKLEKVGVGSNVIHQVPHNAVREQVMGNVDRTPTADELRKMEEVVDQGMRDGAWGMATGLIYTPGSYCKTDELIALSKIVHKHGGFYASHIRNEGTEVLAAIEEILEIARKVGLRVHISHIKVSGVNAWGRGGDVVAVIRRAQEQGIRVTADQYPYTASSTSLAATVISAKFRTGSDADLRKRFDDPELGAALRANMTKNLSGRGGGKIIRIAQYKANPKWQGKDLATIAAEEKKDVIDLAIEIQKNGGASIVNFGMNDEEVRLFMKEPWVATASDGSARVPASDVPHPRSYGCFPRKIGLFAIADKVITLEQAIRSASGLPADILKLPERGYIKSGYFADIVVFDPKTFRDTATFDNPHRYATGVQYLFVNGRPVIAAGEFDARPAGRVLRHPQN